MENLLKNQTPTITLEKALKLKNTLFLDARSQKEFQQAHIPDSINLPILNNEDRALVGTIYKQVSKTQAIDKAMQLFQPKINNYLKKIPKNKTIIVYCWRGGLRSKVITNLLNQNNIKAFQLELGHKNYMNYVWKQLEKPYKPKFITLFGNTGTRKTEIITRINLPKIDLEGLAQHRSSLFGSINLIPRTQKMFSTLLYNELNKLKNEKYVIIEGESKKIGTIFLPEIINKKINSDLKIRVQASIKTRINTIKKEYFKDESSIKKISEITDKLTKFFGKKKIYELKTQINNKEYNKFIEFILLEYYDKRYIHNKQPHKYNLTINSDNLDKAIKEIEGFI